MLKAVAAPWAETTCSQTWNDYAFHEKEDTKLIQTKINKETVSLFKALAASWADTTCPQIRKCLCFSWTGILKVNINNRKKNPRGSLLKAVAALWDDTTCSQTTLTHLVYNSS